MRIAILDDYQDVVRHLDCFRLLDGHEVRVFTHPARGAGQLAARLAGFDAVVLTRERTRLGEDVLARLPNLRLICQTGKVGPHIDVAACTRRGIVVTESSGYPTATAEFTWLLILAAMRRLPAYLKNLYAGQWQRSIPASPAWPLAGLGESLAGKTLGIWGYGRIGQIVGRFGRAFGMSVLIHGRESSLAAAAADGFTPVPDRAEFFAACDVLTLHLRLVEQTRGIVTSQLLARMKPNALLVNTSRAELIEPGALVAALRAGRPGLAAVDVFEREPVTLDEPLLALPNAVCTPHLGFTERQSYERLFGGAFRNLLAFVDGCPSGVANPEVLTACR
ncbi:MAG: D-2-hydroxyacid dehydrogenase family protein [Sutterellaceae bacterium]|nr:D-2-hydroxyacid dehydrogenase family protein [Burkholderiaceae bacterium]MCX7900912.1 D-2-hydroxyacid dehydrogenase family protein [Burkholderiaceae bacterium]MDW8429752.1 D-2-hydroxyacid dehydrogenase family protein [Sutterellaceae bacterium]